MDLIRGKTLKEWKDDCKDDFVPIKTMKYITCLEDKLLINESKLDYDELRVQFDETLETFGEGKIQKWLDNYYKSKEK